MTDSENSPLTNNKEEETKTLLKWTSPSRPFKKRDRDFFTTIGAMAFLIIVIVAFAQEWVFILAIISFIFMVYVLNTVPPESVGHEITNNGITSANHSYVWTDFREFWFVQKYQIPMLVIQTKLRFPSRIIILLNDQDQNKIKELLSPHLLFKEAPVKNWMDKASEWLSQKVRFEKTS